MKHTVRITILLIVIFLIAQIMGLTILNKYIDHKTTAVTGEVEFEELPYDIERPQMEAKTSVLYVVGVIIIGTIFVLLLIRFKQVTIWKIWFLFAVFFALIFAFGAFMPQFFALLFALIFALWKIYRPNVIVHNFTEVFMYGGIAAIFVPVLNVFWVFILLLVISAYDMFAVWKSKHMIKMAKFQASSRIFAGLLIPYKMPLKPLKKITKKMLKKRVKVQAKTAILGGGDIAFPLFFAGVVMKDLMLKYSLSLGFLLSLIVPVTTTIALAVLLFKSRKDRFYPAMPFVSIGCFVGYVIVWLIGFI